LTASLEHVRLKLDRAKEHLDETQRELKGFYAGEPCAVSLETTATDPPRQIIRVKLTPPLRLGILAGESICALRSALDHLAWQLALLSTDSPYALTEFPVCWDETKMPSNEALIARVTRSIQSDAVEEMRRLQPYLWGQEYRADPLWQVNKLCNIDKHRIIAVSGTFVEFESKLTETDIESVHWVKGNEMVFVLASAIDARNEAESKSGSYLRQQVR